MPKKNKKSNKKTGPITFATKKREQNKDTKKNELVQLQDSLSSFFTPTSSRRLRSAPVPQLENIEYSDDSMCISPKPLMTTEKYVDHGLEPGPSSRQKTNQPTAAKKQKQKIIHPPKMLDQSNKKKKSNPKTKNKKLTVEAGISEEEVVVPPGHGKKYYYKGFCFEDCPNGIIDPNGIGAKELIEVFKSMEARNRRNPDFKEFSDINSDSSFEDQPKVDYRQYRNQNAYLNACRSQLRKKLKKKDGLTREQRRERRQFKREFAEILEVLNRGHNGVCDDAFEAYVAPPEATPSSVQRYSDFSDVNESESSDDDYEDHFEVKSEPIPPEDLVDFRQRFEALDFKPITETIPNWRLMLPPKEPRSGASSASSESSATTASNEAPKPVDYTSEDKQLIRQRYRSSIDRVMYRRLVRRACRGLRRQNNRRKQIHQFLEIGDYRPTTSTANVVPRYEEFRPDELDSDDSVQEIEPLPPSYDEILARMPPDMRKGVEEIFENARKETAERLKAVAEAKGPVPKFIHTNRFKIKTLYSSLFPEYLQTATDLYICDLCFQGYIEKPRFTEHMNRCSVNEPPGLEIYKDDKNGISVFEVDALRQPGYCQMICAWSRCYIDHKTLWLDIQPFLFYVLVRRENGNPKNRFVGYFSKQKYQYSSCNLCCLLILPCYQGLGYGRFMVEFSFLLSKVEKIPGAPEKPLSETADILYYQYYLDSFYETTYQVYHELIVKGENTGGFHPLTLEFLEEQTAINRNDLLKVLMNEKIAEIIYDKKNKKKAVDIKFSVDVKKMIEHIKNVRKKLKLKLDPILLNSSWRPSTSDTFAALKHFPRPLPEVNVNEDVEMAENDDDEEAEIKLPKQKGKRGRKKKSGKIVLSRGMSLKEFEDKISDPEIAISAAFTQKEDFHPNVPKRAPKKGKKKSKMSKKRKKAAKKAVASEKIDDPPFTVEKQTPSPRRKFTMLSDDSEVSTDNERCSISNQKVQRKMTRKTCKPREMPQKFNDEYDSDDDDRPKSPQFHRKRQTRQQKTVDRNAANPQQSTNNDSRPKCVVMSGGTPKTRAAQQKKQVLSSEDEAPIQHIRARIRGSSLESSSTDDDNRQRTSRKRATRQMKTDDLVAESGPAKRSSRQMESAPENDEDLQHDETADFTYVDLYDNYPTQMDPCPRKREPMMQMEHYPPKIETDEMPKLIKQVEEKGKLVTVSVEDDDDDEAPPMLSPMHEPPQLNPSNCEPNPEAHRRSPSNDSDGPPILQQHSHLNSMVQNQPPPATDPNVELIQTLPPQSARRSSEEQGFIMQNITAPESCGLNFQGSTGHPSSAGSLHPASTNNMTHTYPNSAGNMGTPQMASNQMHSVQNTASSWSVDMPYPTPQPQDLMFPISAAQNPQMEMVFSQQPESMKEQPKPKRSAKKKKTEKAVFVPPTKYPTMSANPYDQTTFSNQFLQPYNNMAMNSQMGASASYYGGYNQQTMAGYSQNPMQWPGNSAYANYGNFMNTQLVQPQKFYPSLPAYPILPGSSQNSGTIPNPMPWQRPQTSATNPSFSQFYNTYPYYYNPT